jgi:leucyl-tRNA synthetase
VFVNNKWPEYDESQMKDDTVEIAVQINGKMKGKVTIAADASQENAIAAAKEALGDKFPENIVKQIYVPGRIINIVAK